MSDWLLEAWPRLTSWHVDGEVGRTVKATTLAMVLKKRPLAFQDKTQQCKSKPTVEVNEPRRRVNCKGSLTFTSQAALTKSVFTCAGRVRDLRRFYFGRSRHRKYGGNPPSKLYAERRRSIGAEKKYFQLSGLLPSLHPPWTHTYTHTLGSATDDRPPSPAPSCWPAAAHTLVPPGTAANGESSV